MVYRFLLLFFAALLLPLISYSTEEYVVKKGDNLYDISKKYGVSIEDLKNENDLKNSNLDVGDKLRIPGSAGTVAKETKSQDTNRNNIYVVKSGDTLSQIADNHGILTKDLKRENNLKSSNLKIGQELVIPSPMKLQDVAQSSDIHIPEWDTSITVRPKEDTSPQTIEEVSVEKALPSTYTVKKGDIPSTIAESLGVKTNDLMELNSLKAKNLQIGQVLKVPGAQAPEQTATAAAEDKTSESAKQVTKETKTAKEENIQKAQKAQSSNIYVVKKGDTPSEIAEKLGVKTNELISLNNLNSKGLQIGQKLKVPGAESVTLSQKPKAESKPEIPEVYTVKKGDSLSVISERYKVSISDIKKNNNLRSNNLKIGQKLALTEKSKEAKQASAEDLERQKRTGKYTVKKGDTIDKIALKFGVSQKELKRDNGLRSNNIRIGQVLKVPGGEDTKTVKSSENSTEKTEKKAFVKKRYVVKSGDTLSGIANKFGVSVKELKKTSLLSSDKINKGDVLLIPVPHDYVASSPKAPSPVSTAPTYTVVTGDTLGGIAAKHGITVSKLKAENGLSNNELFVGMKLNIPGGAVVKPSAPKTVKSVRKTYTVKRGDTLGVIARRHGVTVSGLKRENELRTSSIRVGQTLKIPGTSKYTHTYSASQNGHSNTGYSSEIKKSPKYNIIKVAKKYLGAPYKFGGNSYKTGIDCSGYVKKVFSSFNVELPRTARDIYYKSGHRVAKSELETGDLVFFTTYAKFPSHVGIYIGDDQFIHASSARKRVTITDLNKRYYRNRYIGAKRIQVSGLFYDEYSKNIEGRQ